MAQLTPPAEAFARIESEAKRLFQERPQEQAENSTTIELESATLIGRTISTPLYADRDIPPFNRAAMDGIALRSEDFASGKREFQIIATIFAGNDSSLVPSADTIDHALDGAAPAVAIMTGAAVPAWANAVVRREDYSVSPAKRVIVEIESVEPWQHIARKGEDAVTGSELLTAGNRIDTPLLPLLSACGVAKVHVATPPKISLITTGSEVLPVRETPLPWQIRDASSSTIRALLRQRHSIELRRHEILGDNRDALRKSIEESLACDDLLLLTGGVSMGEADHIPDLLRAAGVEVFFHRLAIKPGKPLLYGAVRRSDGSTASIFALPGNPVSSVVTFRIFVDRWISHFQGQIPQQPLYLPLAEPKRKKHDLEEYTQYRFATTPGRASEVVPIRHHGSGDFAHLAGTAGLLIHPAASKELAAGTIVELHPWHFF